MWGKLIFNDEGGVIEGWMVDSWTGITISAAEQLQPVMHWVEAQTGKFHRMRFAGDISPSIQVFDEDKEIDPRRKAFIEKTLAQWEKEWVAEGSPMQS
jgi:hypothetical protein